MMFLEWAQFQSLCFIVNFWTMLIKYKPTLYALFSYDIAYCWMQIIYGIYCTYLDFVFFLKRSLLYVQYQESLMNVQALLHQHPKSNKGMLSMVDHLKRLCIDNYFQDEIDNIMDSSMDLLHSDDLLDATISLRLMREVGYYISAGQ